MPNGKSKPLSLVKGHRTKAEKELRTRAEKALSTTEKIKPSVMLKENAHAMKYYKRLRKIFAGVDMDEAFFENVLCRYCLMLAEHDGAIAERVRAQEAINDLYTHKDELPYVDFAKLLVELNVLLATHDKTIAKKRDQLLSIEKENLMTMQGKLRAVPKKPQQEAPSGIAAYMQRREGG